jgi:hypothetical protein
MEARMSHRERTAMMFAGYFLLEKFRQQCAVSGTFRAALNLKKQGCDLTTALLMLRGL